MSPFSDDSMSLASNLGLGSDGFSDSAQISKLGLRKKSIAHDFKFPKEKNIRNIWTEEQKQLLCVLERFFWSANSEKHVLSTEDRHEVLCCCFAETFITVRSERRISKEAINSQYDNLKRYRKPAWLEVFERSPGKDGLERWSAMRADIRKISLILGISLQERNETFEERQRSTPKSSRSRIQKKSRQAIMERNDSEESQDRDWSDQSEEGGCMSVSILYPCFRLYIHTNQQQQQQQQLQTPPTTPAKSLKTLLSPLSLRKPPPFYPGRDSLSIDNSFHHLDADQQRIRPFHHNYAAYRFKLQAAGLVAFRVWDDSNQGVNRNERFWASDWQAREPPCRNDALFGQSAFLHLHRIEQKTPWISIWASLLPSLHRLLRSNSGSITVIDIELITEDARFTYPRAYPSGSVIKQWNLAQIPYKDGPYTYRGGNEWIVWENIEQEAVIMTISYGQLQEYLEKNPDVAKILELACLKTFESVSLFARSGRTRTRATKDEPTGEVIGKFLCFLGIPERATERISSRIASTWGFQKCSTEAYLKGIRRGYHTFSASRSPDCELVSVSMSGDGYESDFENCYEADHKLDESGSESSDLSREFEATCEASTKNEWPIDTTWDERDFITGLSQYLVGSQSATADKAEAKHRDEGVHHNGPEDLRTEKRENIEKWLAHSDHASTGLGPEVKKIDPSLATPYTETDYDLLASSEEDLMSGLTLSDDMRSSFAAGSREAGEASAVPFGNRGNDNDNNNEQEERYMCEEFVAGLHEAALGADEDEDAPGSFEARSAGPRLEEAPPAVDFIRRRQGIKQELSPLLEDLPEAWETSILDEGATL